MWPGIGCAFCHGDYLWPPQIALTLHGSVTPPQLLKGRTRLQETGLEKYCQSAQAEKEKKSSGAFCHQVAFQRRTRAVCQRQCVSLPMGRKTQRPPLTFSGAEGWGALGQDPQRRASGPSAFCCCRPPPTQGALGQGQRGIRWTMTSVVGGRNTRTRKRRTAKKRGRIVGMRSVRPHGLGDQCRTAVIWFLFVVTNFNCVTQQD